MNQLFQREMIEGMVERKVPVIDILDFPGQSQKLREACEAWGCFRIVNHKIPVKLMSEMKAVARSLLDLPSEIKRRNAIWSNKWWRNLKHCVPCKEATTWVSIATFLLGLKQKVIEAPPELVDPEHLRLCGPVVHEDVRNLRISKNLLAGKALTVMRAQF